MTLRNRDWLSSSESIEDATKLARHFRYSTLLIIRLLAAAYHRASQLFHLCTQVLGTLRKLAICRTQREGDTIFDSEFAPFSVQRVPPDESNASAAALRSRHLGIPKREPGYREERFEHRMIGGNPNVCAYFVAT